MSGCDLRDAMPVSLSPAQRLAAVERLELALDSTEDAIEQLWDIQCTWLVEQEWTRLRGRCLAIERTLRRLGR